MDLPATTNRVSQQTAEQINECILRQMEVRLQYYAHHPEHIGGRLDELDHEWDMERTLETNASSIALFGLGLGAIVNRRFYLLPVAVLSFLLQHAFQGWCPPVPFFRKRGVRTQSEIEAERYALKALRGDFADVGEATAETRQDARADAALRAVRR